MSESFLPSFAAPGVDKRDLTLPRFYIRPVPNAFKSTQEGRPIFDDVEYVEILVPGARGTLVDERVKDEHRARWPQFYQAFKAGAELAAQGWPLEEWTGVTRSQVEELKHFHVRNVETLAALDDAALQRAAPMGGYALREKAKLALEQAAGAAPAERLAAENAAQRETMDVMQQTLADLQAEVARLSKGKGAEG